MSKIEEARKAIEEGYISVAADRIRKIIDEKKISGEKRLVMMNMIGKIEKNGKKDKMSREEKIEALNKMVEELENS